MFADQSMSCSFNLSQSDGNWNIVAWNTASHLASQEKYNSLTKRLPH